MAHFAIIDIKSNKVIQVTPISNDIVGDSFSKESELKGIEFLNKLFKNPTNVYFKQTSFNENFRKNFAGIGDVWDEKLDGFIKPTPEAAFLITSGRKVITVFGEVDEMIADTGEWVLNEKTCRWEWISASIATQSMFRRAVNAIVELPNKIINIVTPKKSAEMEKYKGSYLKFLIVDSYNWAGVLVALAIYLIVAIDSGFALGSYFFLIPLALMVFITIRTYRENKQGKSS